jgi:hypothetical protein
VGGKQFLTSAVQAVSDFSIFALRIWTPSAVLIGSVTGRAVSVPGISLTVFITRTDQIRSDSTRQKLKVFNLNVKIQQNKIIGTNVFYEQIQEGLPNMFYIISQQDTENDLRFLRQ